MSSRRILGTLAVLLLPGCLAVWASDGRTADHGMTIIPAEGAIGPYSGAVLAGGFCFASGKIAKQRDGTFEEEVASALDQVEAQLDAVGLDLHDVVSATVYLTDMGNYGAFNEIYGARFGGKNFPARTCVAVAALPAGARVEVQVIAKLR